MKIPITAALVLGSILLSGCSVIGPTTSGSDEAFVTSLLLAQEDSPVTVSEVLEEEIFFGLGYALLPSSECDLQVRDFMIVATSNYSINYKFENSDFEDFSGFIQQQIVGFDEAGIANELFETIRELSSSGKCDESHEINGIRFVVDYRPLVNLPQGIKGNEWSEAYYGPDLRCAQGLTEGGHTRASLLIASDRVIINKVWGRYCVGGPAGFQAAEAHVESVSSALIKSLLTKLS